jgi:hypothetical protein
LAEREFEALKERVAGKREGFRRVSCINATLPLSQISNFADDLCSECKVCLPFPLIELEALSLFLLFLLGCWICVPHVGHPYKEYLATSEFEADLIILVDSIELGFGLVGCFVSLSVYDGRYSVIWLFQRKKIKSKTCIFLVPNYLK